MPDEAFNPVNHTKESDDVWLTMHSRFVMIDNPTEYGLPPSAAGQKPGSNVYAVSAFHQLHCLQVLLEHVLTLIRNAWFAVIENGPQILDGPVHLPGHPAYKSLAGHTTHCFDYIRQSLMCAADSTLEAFLEADGVTPRPQGSTGWGVVHKCKNFDELKDWTEEYRDPGV
ncbi:2OG-Fe(II) oxygenase protein [Rutstroemia sp. NJR-2017a BVV2]|nr:2OG-Fe(II) oxygenase protein [Rutstroemia sp. NJR-2017a BVV2]